MQLATKRLSGAVEAGAIGCIVLLDACCPYLSDKQLMDALQVRPASPSYSNKAIFFASLFIGADR